MNIGIDLDGTLITCEEKHCLLMESLTRAFDIGFCKETYWKYKRSGFNNIECLVKQEINLSEAKLLNKLWVDNVENIEWAYYDKLIVGVYDKLSKLKSNGHMLHLISARTNKVLGLQKIKQTDLDRLFDSVTFINIIHGEKKSVVMRNKDLKAYVGDTEQDYNMAVLAGVKPILVSSGMRNMELLKKYSDNVFNSLTAIEIEN